MLIQLLAQTGEFVGVAEVFRGDFFVVLAGVRLVDGFAVRVGTLAPGLRAAGAVVAFRDGGFFLGFRSVVVGRFAFHFFGLRAEHGFGFGLRLSVAILGVILLAGLLAAVLAVLGVIVLVSLGLGFRQLQRSQQFAGGARERLLVAFGGAHFRQCLIGAVAQRIAPHIQDALRRLGGWLAGQPFARQ